MPEILLALFLLPLLVLLILPLLHALTYLYIEAWKAIITDVRKLWPKS